MQIRKGQCLFKVLPPKTEDMTVSMLPESASMEPASSSVASHIVSIAGVALTGSVQCGKAWVPISLNDKVKKAEVLFTLKLAASNYSSSSYSDITDVCRAAFVDSEIAQHMKLGDMKVSYLLVHGLAPYFESLFLNDCRAGVYFTIYFDETTTRQIKKQMDIHVAFWSPKFKKMIAVYVTSVFLGHADASKIEQYRAMLVYFLKTLPKSANSSATCSGEKYTRIRTALSDDTTIVYLNFVAFTASTLTGFLKMSQTNEPLVKLVHVLYDKLNELVCMVLLKFVKSELGENKEGVALAELQCSASDN